MAELKTKATGASVEEYISAQVDPQRREDCRQLIELYSLVTGHPPKMWGPSIVGFDQYHYRYDSGREGDMAAAGFSSRKPELAIYLLADSDRQRERLSRLGKHKMGKSCLYVRRLSDVDLSTLKELIEGSYREIKHRYPAASNA
jgi:hypothetical protein